MITLSNKDSRKLLLFINHLHVADGDDKLISVAKIDSWAPQMITSLGFVQIDPISAVEKAHYSILFSRNRHFKKEWLTKSLEDDRTTFENWTHDAAILPTEFYPYWKHYFKRFENFEIHKGYKVYFKPLAPKIVKSVYRHIEKEGPTKPSDLKLGIVEWNDAYASKTSLSKIAAELLWRTGKLCVTRREALAKVYDLSERVIPEKYYERQVAKSEYTDWACKKALQQLGFARPAQMAHYMDAISKDTALEWCRAHRNEVEEIQVTFADGALSQPVFALSSVLEKIDGFPVSNKNLRLLNPFDPLIHDRIRTNRIFGFDYTIEIWVPKSKRKYGYYVLPILEGDKFTGRIDLKTDRKAGKLNVLGLWWEPGVKETKARLGQLKRELKSLARFAGVEKVV